MVWSRRVYRREAGFTAKQVICKQDRDVYHCLPIAGLREVFRGIQKQIVRSASIEPVAPNKRAEVRKNEERWKKCCGITLRFGWDLHCFWGPSLARNVNGGSVRPACAQTPWSQQVLQCL